MTAEAAARAILAAPEAEDQSLALILASLGQRVYAHSPYPDVLAIVPSEGFGAPFVLVDVSGRRGVEVGDGVLAAWTREDEPIVGILTSVRPTEGGLLAVGEDGSACRLTDGCRLLGVVVGLHDLEGTPGSSGFGHTGSAGGWTFEGG